MYSCNKCDGQGLIQIKFVPDPLQENVYRYETVRCDKCNGKGVIVAS